MEDGAPPHRCLAGDGGSPRHVGGPRRESSRAGASSNPGPSFCPYSPECVERLYEKSSNTGEPPRHEANHGSLHERLATRTQPLVIFAHPPVLVDPCDRPLHYPPTRQHHKAFGGHEFLPIYGHALLGPFLRPRHQHCFWGWLFRTLHEIHAPSQGLLYPVCALVLSTVARVQPQVREAGKLLVRPSQQRLDPLLVHDLCTVDLRLEYETLGIYQDVALRLP